MEGEAELWNFLERHLRSIYEGDWATWSLPSTSGS